MSNDMGLKGFFENNDCKGCKTRYWIKEFLYQIKYAWQRAWRGYDDTDVFNAGQQLLRRIPIVLKGFLEWNLGLWYDKEIGRYLTPAEQLEIIFDMIHFFENCDDDTAYHTLYGEHIEDSDVDKDTAFSRAKEVYKFTEHNKNEGMKLLTKWVFHL